MVEGDDNGDVGCNDYVGMNDEISRMYSFKSEGSAGTMRIFPDKDGEE